MNTAKQNSARDTDGNLPLVSSIELARKMTSQFAAGAVLDEIPGAKLFAHEDHPREFATLALRFLDRQLAAESRRQSA
jgi:pimeloyl-ACP methyl ester carboxylesterase